MSGIIDEKEEPPSPVLMLIPEDYPEIFRDPNNLFAHPKDLKIDMEPITPKLFLYKNGTRTRLFLRISMKLAEKSDPQFTAATFLLDTSACAHMYLSPSLFNLVKSRVCIQDIGPDYIKTEVGGKKVNCLVKQDLPAAHQPANVMGLPMLFLMGLQLKQERISLFTFKEDGTADDVAMQQFQYI